MRVEKQYLTSLISWESLVQLQPLALKKLCQNEPTLTWPTFLLAEQLKPGKRVHWWLMKRARIMNNGEKALASVVYGCAPPAPKKSRSIPRYQIKVGTRVEVTPLSGPISWEWYQVETDMSFERFERYRDRQYTFRAPFSMVRVHRSQVVHREDAPGYNVGK